MTLDQFYARLQETPREWVLLDGGLIRMTSFAGGCPICVVAGHRDAIGWWDAYKALGLDFHGAALVAYASDNWEGHSDPAVRAKLLSACGLAGL